MQENHNTLPSGRQVRPSEKEPFYGALSSAELQLLANPMGVLTVHVVHAKNLDTGTIEQIFPTAKILDYYLRVDFLDRQYFSKVCCDIRPQERRIIFDDLITFTIDDIAPNEGSEAQNVVFNLIALDEMDPHRHIVIGQAEKPLLKFIRDMIASEILLLSRPAKINPIDGGYEGQRAMGTMLIKAAFAYGRFGYGYSNQIFDDRMSPSDAVRHCMFPR